MDKPKHGMYCHCGKCFKWHKRNGTKPLDASLLKVKKN